MEMLVHKDHFEQYWWSKDALLTLTPSFPEVMSCNRFPAIWSLLHCVNKDDENIDRNAKLYKTRPIFNHLFDKFKQRYEPGCDSLLDERMIPMKNKLSFKQLLHDAHHDVERAETASRNNHCKMCGEKYLRVKQMEFQAEDKDLPKPCKTVYRCKYCEEFLCIGKPGSNCWFDWHHKHQY
uniref:PiggyBac transposable element-derived protein domain-containing protein n=1 Tax=Octopus bimaculoides TaxID=37653 RepID=A0A0L8H925_OCTBM